jgi:hypothetical protein
MISAPAMVLLLDVFGCRKQNNIKKLKSANGWSFF